MAGDCVGDGPEQPSRCLYRAAFPSVGLVAVCRSDHDCRVGYYYGKFGIHDVSNFEVNLAYLPSELLQGITVGASLDIPHWSDKLGFRAAVDALYPNGKRTQTQGLEDGDASKVFAFWGTAGMTYQWKPNLAIEVGYRYSYAKTDWVGEAEASMRPHGATVAARKDVGHTAMLGVGKQF